MLKMCQRGDNPSERQNHHGFNKGVQLNSDKGSHLSKNVVQTVARWLAGIR